MGFSDRENNLGENRGVCVRSVRSPAEGRRKDQHECNRVSEAPKRPSFGMKSSGARGSQAAADALRRRQKAKKAALTKRYATYKSRARLLEDFAERKATESDVYVAPELQNVFSSEEQGTCGKDVPRRDRSEVDTLPDKRRNELAPPSKHLRDDKAQKKRSRKRDVDAASCDTGVEDESSRGTLVVDRDPAEISRGSGSKKALPVRENGRIVKSRKYMPFRKELDLAAARQREIDLRHERFAREDRAHKERREKEASTRKMKSRRFRKVTRRGQPVMKHRVDALLERLEQSRQG